MNATEGKSHKGTAIFSSFIGGIGQEFLNIIPPAWMDSFLFRTALAASVSALCGLLIKDAYLYFRSKIKK